MYPAIGLSCSEQRRFNKFAASEVCFFCSKTAYAMLPYTAEQEVIVSWKKERKTESSKATGRETLSGAEREIAFYAEPGRPQ